MARKKVSIVKKSPTRHPFTLYGACAHTNSMLDLGSTVFVKARMSLKGIPTNISVSPGFWLLLVNMHSVVLCDRMLCGLVKPFPPADYQLFEAHRLDKRTYLCRLLRRLEGG